MVKELKAKHVADRKMEREAAKAAKELEPKRKPGRPKKVKVLESSEQSDDLVLKLLAAAAECEE